MRNSTSGFRILATFLDIGANKVSSFHFRRGSRIDCALWKFEAVAHSRC